MVKVQWLVRGLAVMVMLFACAASALAQEYPVRFARADKTGLKTRHDVTLEKTVTRTKATVGDPRAAQADAAMANRLVISAQFTREVVEAPNSDHPLRLLVTFQKLTLAQQEKAARAVVPPGTQVRATAYRGDPLVFEAVAGEGGQAPVLDEVALAMLDMLVTIPDATDDECFGTTEKKGAGMAWPVNNEAMTRTMLGGTDSRTKPETVSGTVKVEKLEKVDGADCAVVTVAYSATYKAAASHGPMDVKDMGSKVMGSRRVTVPVDGISPVRGKSSDVTSTAVTHVIGPSVTTEVKVQSRTRRDETVSVVAKK